MLNPDYTQNRGEEWLEIPGFDTLTNAPKEPIELGWPIFDDFSSFLAWGNESSPSETCSTPLTLISDQGLSDASETQDDMSAHSDDDLEEPTPPDESELYAVDCDLYEHRYAAETTSAVLSPLADGEESKVDLFLEESGLYDVYFRRWCTIPTDPSDAQSLVSPFQDIFEAILRCFQVSGSRFVARGPMARQTAHGHSSPYKPTPILAISGIGSVFGVETGPGAEAIPPSKKSYPSLLTPIDVKLKKECWLATDLAQLGLFARRCFFHQHNRTTVFSLLANETSVQLFQFDRSGVQYFPPFDIHDDPVGFVRLVLKVASEDDFLAGIDASIYWQDGVRYIRAPVAKQEMELLRVVDDRPICIPERLTGKVTICWKVRREPSGATLLVKDSWTLRSKSTSEIRFLRMARGHPGLAQLVGHGGGALLSRMRGHEIRHIFESDHFTFRQFTDRRFVRITMEYYERSIEQFNDKLELLCAFRDAVKGHSNLWQLGVYHQNIRPANIRFGNPKSGSDAGNQGVLVGFGRATEITRPNGTLSESIERPRNFFFHSIVVLCTYYEGLCAHDYFDDLESFFYVLCWICSSYTGPHTRSNATPPTLVPWECLDPLHVYDVKTAFMLSPTGLPAGFVTPYFGRIFKDLLENLRCFLGNHVHTRLEWLKLGFERVLLEPKKDYCDFLGLIDIAIQSIREEICVDGAQQGVCNPLP